MCVLERPLLVDNVKAVQRAAPVCWRGLQPCCQRDVSVPLNGRDVVRSLLRPAVKANDVVSTMTLCSLRVQ